MKKQRRDGHQYDRWCPMVTPPPCNFFNLPHVIIIHPSQIWRLSCLYLSPAFDRNEQHNLLAALAYSPSVLIHRGKGIVSLVYTLLCALLILLTSCATRAATVVAAIRRGCVQRTILPPWAHPASYKYYKVMQTRQEERREAQGQMMTRLQRIDTTTCNNTIPEGSA